MKKLILIFVVLLAFVSCDSFDEGLCEKSVKDTFQGSDIYSDGSYHFIVVKTNGQILAVSTMSMISAKISSINVLMKVQSK